MESTSEKHNETAARGATFSVEESTRILKFIHARTHDPDSGLVERFRGVVNGKKMWLSYIQESGTNRTVIGLQGHFHKLMLKLHLMPLEIEAKLDIYYSLDVPVHTDFLATAHKHAFMVLDKEKHIEMFEMKPAELVEQEEKKKAKKRRSSVAGSTSAGKVARFNEEEQVKMWKFVLKKMTDAETGKVVKDGRFKLQSKKLWEEFIEAEKGQRSAASYISHIRKADPHSVALDIRTKTGLLFGLNMPVKQELLEQIQEKTHVKVDEEGHILEYNSTDLIPKPLRLRM